MINSVRVRVRVLCFVQLLLTCTVHVIHLLVDKGLGKLSISGKFSELGFEVFSTLVAFVDVLVTTVCRLVKAGGRPTAECP